MNEPAVLAEGATSTHLRESFLFFIQSWLRQKGSWKERRRTPWVSGASALTIKQAAASAHQVCITRRALCSAPTPTICGTSTRPIITTSDKTEARKEHAIKCWGELDLTRQCLLFPLLAQWPQQWIPLQYVEWKSRLEK